MINLIFLIAGLGALALIDRWLVKKLHKSESEMTQLDFEMRPPKWIRMLNLIWVGVGIYVTVIAVIDSLIIFSFILLGFTALGARLLWMKIIVKDNMIKTSKLLWNSFTFDELSGVMAEQYPYADVIFDKVTEAMLDQFYEVKCYNKRGRKKLKFDSEWSGFLLMMNRLFDLGILPWLETNRKNKDRKNLAALMDFLIENDLTNWYSFNKKEAIDVGFKLYKHDLTEKGQYLFTSGAVIRWGDYVNLGGRVSNFSLLEDAMAKYEKLKRKDGERRVKTKKTKPLPKNRKKRARKNKKTAS